MEFTVEKLPVTSLLQVYWLTCNAQLFCWHTQQRSLIGRMTVMLGISRRQSEKKVVYATPVNPASSHDAEYTIQTVTNISDHVIPSNLANLF